MATFDLRADEDTILMHAGDSLDGFEITVDDPAYAAGTWSAQIRPTADSDTLHGSFTITPNGGGTGVVLTLSEATVRGLHDSYASTVRDDEGNLVNRYVGVSDVQSVAAGVGTFTARTLNLVIDQDVTRP